MKKERSDRLQSSSPLLRLTIAVAALFLGCGFSSAFADSATWKLNPSSGDWNTAANWTPATVPNKIGDGIDATATFGTSSTTTVSLFSGVLLNGIVFDPGASAFTITATSGGFNTLNIDGLGVTNNSGIVQRFHGDVFFRNTATAGTLTSFVSDGPNAYIDFLESSSAGSANFINEGGINGSGQGVISFLHSSTAGDGVFTNNGAAGSSSTGGIIFFENNSTAGNGNFTNNAGPAYFSQGGGEIQFGGSSTAGNGFFTVNGGPASGQNGALLQFYGNSTADSAVLVANGGLEGGEGAVINFAEASTGATVRIKVLGNGRFYISDHNAPGMSCGSIEGSGLIFLGANRLTVGANNLGTTFSGIIQDGGFNGGIGGSLLKTGSGTLTLSGHNTYTGGTTVAAGTLTATADHRLNSGNVVVAAGAALVLKGGVTNDYVDDAASLAIASGSTVDLDFGGSPDRINALLIDGQSQAPGLYGGSESNATLKIAQFTGSGSILVGPSTPVAQLLNISTRMKVLTGDNVLIGGFIITGNAPKKIILRAIGPSLSDADPAVPGALADPVLELYEPDGTVITNDDWKDTQESEIEATNLAPKKAKESTIVTTLSPGAYTAIVRGKDGGTGIGLVEVYDFDQVSDSTLANISSRGFVDTGDNVMIGGLIIGGADSTVLVRAIGPSLANANPPVPGALADTTLELHDKDGAIIDFNDDWKDSQQVEIEATGAQPKNAKESAIVEALPGGNYTAIVRGKSDTTGVALVEVYNITP